MEGDCTVNGEPQKKFTEMAKEIQITREMSDLGCNFIKLERLGHAPSVYIHRFSVYNI